jgi:hypothetical protein
MQHNAPRRLATQRIVYLSGHAMSFSASQRNALQRSITLRNAARRTATLRRAVRRHVALRSTALRGAARRIASSRLASQRNVFLVHTETKMNPKKPPFQMSPDVERLVHFLLMRDQASYAEMNAHIGRRLDGRDRYVLASACRILENRGIFFIAERGVGVIRANNSEIATLSTSHPIKKVQRITRRATKRQAHVDVQRLSADERLAFYVGRVVINAIGKDTLQSFRARIAKEIQKSGDEMLTINQITALPRLKPRR